MVDPAEAPEDDGDALGEVVLDLTDGCEAVEGALEVLVPAGGLFEAGDSGVGAVGAVRDGVLADDVLAVRGARAGGAEGVLAVGGDLPGGGHGVELQA